MHKEICDKYGDEADILNSNNILFLLYDYNKDYVGAKDTLKKSIELGKRLKKYNMLVMAKLYVPAREILESRVKFNIAKL